MTKRESRPIMLILRIVQAIFALIVLGLAAYIVNWWNDFSPSQIDYLLFCSAWTILALLYLIIVPSRLSKTIANHKFAILAVEMITMIVWFAGFIAMTVFLSDRNGPCVGNVCAREVVGTIHSGSATAACVFAALEWLAFAASTTTAVMHVVRTRNQSSRDDKADPNNNVVQEV